jgi:ketosteroid isomerase-like protein
MIARMTTEDREAIRELLHRYCHHADAPDAEKWAALYTEDGSFRMGSEPVEGRPALHELASGFAGGGMHVSANAVISLKGDEATVSSYVVLLGGTDDPAVRLGGRYEDRLRKVDGEWLFASRQFSIQLRRSS